MRSIFRSTVIVALSILSTACGPEFDSDVQEGTNVGDVATRALPQCEAEGTCDSGGGGDTPTTPPCTPAAFYVTNRRGANAPLRDLLVTASWQGITSGPRTDVTVYTSNVRPSAGPTAATSVCVPYNHYLMARAAEFLPGTTTGVYYSGGEVTVSGGAFLTGEARIRCDVILTEWATSSGMAYGHETYCSAQST
jgi:hypothetical protein